MSVYLSCISSMYDPAAGDLYEELKRNRGRLQETRVAATIIYPCMLALSYLHSKVTIWIPYYLSEITILLSKIRTMNRLWTLRLRYLLSCLMAYSNSFLSSSKILVISLSGSWPGKCCRASYIETSSQKILSSRLMAQSSWQILDYRLITHMSGQWPGQEHLIWWPQRYELLPI